jgi:dihydrofolate reductase
MRKITFGGANSLDNFIAREDGTVDWLLWSDEVSARIGEFWAKIDTVLMGRKTYETALAHSKGQKNPYPGIKTYVFSRTWQAGEREDGAVVVNEGAEEFVRELKNQEGREICVMGGGDFAAALFEAELIDEIGFNIHPVMLGRGIPLFHRMTKQIDLELIECRPLKTGCVFVSYRVKK